MRLLLLSLLSLSFATQTFAQTPAPVKAPDAPKTKTQLTNEERDELKSQYELLLQKQKNKIAEVETEYNKVSLENKLNTEKNTGEMARVKAELEKISSENKLAEEKFKALLSPQTTELQKLLNDNKLAEEGNKKALAALTLQLAKIKVANDIAAEKQREQVIADTSEKNKMDMEMKKMDFEERKMRYEKTQLESRMDKLNSDLALRTKKEEWKKEANVEPVYAAKPYDGDKLVVSDRRIAMNGPIVSYTADYVTDRIHYFNNISTAPIFIVINNSPGGSVMAGYRILKAMQASRAPVYVVVKSFAASMAATITTLAEKSFVYQNAIILHHQMSTMNWGNMTQLKEQLDLAREWEKRLMLPIAKKIGMDMEAFRKKMYEKSSDGDWEEFGDKAVEYKWAGAVVDRIEETGLVKNPDFDTASPAVRRMSSLLEEKTDDKGQKFMALPRLEPYDFYFIYNPDKYYR